MMEFQCSFQALSLSSSQSDAVSTTVHEVGYSSSSAGIPHFIHSIDVGAFPSALIFSDYPFRILKATASFAEVLGFRPEDLNGSSLRLCFGPCTDVHKLKKILQNKGQDDNDRIIFYRKNGDEVACSIQSSCTHMPSGETLSSIAILSYRSSTVSDGLRTETERNPITTSTFDAGVPEASVDPSLIHDPGLLMHLRAIRRSRRSSIA
jgi:hypothetical protein